MLLASNALIKVVPGLMIWTLVAFGLTLYVLKRYAFGPIQRLIDERRRRILETLEHADRARSEADQLLEEQRQLLAKARGSAEEILADARRVADAQHKRLRDEIDAERQRRLEETRREIQAETQRAIGQIRSEVAGLALEATAKVTGKVLSDKDQQRLIEEAIDELDFSVLERETV